MEARRHTVTHRGRAIGLALVALLLLTCVGQAARAQEGGVRLSAVVGFDGNCREDSWCPVTVTLENEGADVEGELQISSISSGGESGTTYARPVQLPAHSRKAYTLYIPPIGSYFYPSAPLTIRLMAGRTEIGVTTARLNRYLQEQDRLYGVVSSAPSALGFLGDVTPLTGRAIVAPIGLESLPPDPLGWEALDVLILNDVDTTGLSAEQREALAVWVAHGGHLIVGGGSGAARTAAGVSDLLPVAVGAPRSVTTLDALGERAAADALPGPYLLAESTLVAGEVLSEQDGLILLARRRVGAGTVDFLAFDAGLDPFAQRDGLTRLWASLLDTGGLQHTAIHVRDAYSANEAVRTIPEVGAPSLLQLIGFMLAYIVLIGPVNYLVLRKLDRRELAWVTIPALIIVFTALAYFTGFQLRGRSPILHRLTVVTMPEEGEVARVNGLVGLFSPWRTRYDVQAANARIRALSFEDAYTSTEAPPLYVIEEAEASTAVDLSVDIGEVQPIQVEGYLPLERPRADMRLVTTQAGLLAIEGTIQNGPVPLQQASLLIGMRQWALGNLEAGQTVTIPQAIPAARSFLTTSSYYPYYASGSVAAEQYRQDYFTNAYFSGLSTLGTGIYLVGWSDQSPLEVSLVGRAAATSDLTLYIFALPIAPRAASSGGATRTSVPAWAISREVESSAYGWMPAGQFYISPTEPLVIRFAVLPQAMVAQVDRLTLTLSGGYGISLTPRAQLLNWETRSWESLPVAWGQTDIPNPAAYVSPDGVVRLRLSANSDVTLSDVSIRIDGRY